MDLSHRQWELLKPFIEWSEKQRGERRGRPLRDGRQVLNGALWILRTGAQWHDLPARYGPYQTCHRRFQRWVREGTLPGILWALAEDLRARGKLAVDETFVDASFVEAKKGAMELGPTKHGKGSKILAIADRHGLPVAVRVTSASPHECQLVEDTLRERYVEPAPERMVGDRGYDSDPLDQRLREQQGVALIAPHRSNRSKPRTQDGRVLRRYRRRWKVERLFAWLKNYRRILIRWERHASNYLGMVQLGCVLILLRHF
ncbi:MAG: IS5 family transposase [Terriglobales bacterium]